jgi:NAD-reducing hydrogenase small subunit
MTNRKRIATAWLGGCSGCHMSLLDLDEALVDLLAAVDLAFGPLADAKAFPEGVDVTLVEGAVANEDNLELARRIRANSRVVASLGDCAVTGNVAALRNHIPVDALLDALYREGAGAAPAEARDPLLPRLLPAVLPLHRVIEVDAFIPGCPPDPARIREALLALLEGRPVPSAEGEPTFG